MKLQPVILLQQLMTQAIQSHPSKTALISGKKHYSYIMLMNEIRGFATKLKDKGLQRGERVIIQAGNSVETIIAFWATLMSDAVACVVSSDLNGEKLNYIINDSGASVLITHVSSTIEGQSTLNQIYVLGNSATKLNSNTYHMVLGSETETYANKKENYKNNELDLAAIIYTSGSTGEPKGVMLTHRNMLTATFSINQYLEHSEDDVILCALPMSFDYGLYQMIMAFSVAATLVLEKDALLPMQILRKIQTEKITVLPCVPTLFSLLAENAQHFNFDYSSLRAVTNTGAALSPKHIQAIKKIFPKVNIYSMYGLTECKRCTYLPPADIDRKPGSVGIAIPNTELWIVDEQGEKVAPGITGQLVIRGATVMKGYWNKPLESQKKLKPGLLPHEMLLYTGDYAMLDEEGYLYYKGRMDETLKFKGVKISPVEMESIIMQVQHVKEVAVMGVDNSDAETALIVIVAVDKECSHTMVEQLIRQALSRSQQPSRFFFWPTLPKNTNGKIDKKRVKEKVVLQLQSHYHAFTHNIGHGEVA